MEENLPSGQSWREIDPSRWLEPGKPLSSSSLRRVESAKGSPPGRQVPLAVALGWVGREMQLPIHLHSRAFSFTDPDGKRLPEVVNSRSCGRS